MWLHWFKKDAIIYYMGFLRKFNFGLSNLVASLLLPFPLFDLVIQTFSKWHQSSRKLLVTQPDLLVRSEFNLPRTHRGQKPIEDWEGKVKSRFFFALPLSDVQDFRNANELWHWKLWNGTRQPSLWPWNEILCFSDASREKGDHFPSSPFLERLSIPKLWSLFLDRGVMYVKYRTVVKHSHLSPFPYPCARSRKVPI